MSSNAGGKETVLGFNTAKDSMAFSGYALGTPVVSESLAGGSDTITLTDGTQITLAGVDHKMF